jgi:UDP-3-O-[3-hydroxymyristoyl] glucosamine N-acyltransferase
MLHACVVLGAYGFGYSLRAGRHERSAQLGWVELDDDVEVGANTTIDRGTYGPTRIGQGTKLDNQIQIGHNVHLGKHNLMCAQVGIAGSSSTGDYVVLGGQVGVRDHVHLGDHCSAAAQSGIARDIQPHETVMGTPAIASRDSTQLWILSQRLPEMKKQLKELAASIAAIQSQLAPAAESRSKAA